MIEIEISKTRSRSILSDKVSKGLFRAVFSNFHDYLDLFVHKLYASQGRQSHPYKCHRGRRKKGEGRYVRGKEREERRKETACGVVAKARPEVVPSGSLVGLTCWTTSWPEVYHTPTMAATKTTKASFCPVLSLLLNVCLLDQRFRLPSSSHHPPLALRFSYLYDYILLNCSKGELIQLERENSRWRKTEEKRGRKEEFYEQDGNNIKFTIAPRHFAGRQQAAKTK